jgi:hypothetical protein
MDILKEIRVADWNELQDKLFEKSRNNQLKQEKTQSPIIVIPAIVTKNTGTDVKYRKGCNY